MQNGIFFSIVSLIYCIFVSVLFFSKDKIKSRENDIYSRLLIINLIGLFIEVVPATLAIRGIILVSENVLIFLLKLILIYMIIWTLFFTYYIVIVSTKSENKIKIFKYLGVFVAIVSTVVILLLPLNYYINNGAAYSYGMAASYVYIISGILILICISFLIVNIKKIKLKKYYPLIIFILLGIIVIVIPRINFNVISSYICNIYNVSYY